MGKANRPVGRYLIRRIVEVLPTLLLLSMLVFLLMRLMPGDPILTMLGEESEESPERRAELAAQLGLDQPIPIQYVKWLGNVLQGEWGRSIRAQRPVTEVIAPRFIVTMQIAVVAWTLALTAGITIGVIAAIRRNTWVDVGINFGALAGVATPDFLLALVLMTIFAVKLNWFPATGFVALWDDPVNSLRHMALPLVALTTGLMASIIRYTRSSMLEVLHTEYITVARAKGLAARHVIVRHALKNALVPVVTIAALQIRIVVSGTIIVETMFAIPGMGRLAISSVTGNDYPVIQAVVMIIGLFAIGSSLLADIVYSRLDPRIRLA